MAFRTTALRVESTLCLVFPTILKAKKNERQIAQKKKCYSQDTIFIAARNM